MQDPSQMPFVSWMRRAAPYIHAFRGKTFVLSFGGEVMQSEAATALAHDCNLLAALGIRLVLVHGARPQIEAELGRRGLLPRYHRGRRVTDAAALECVKSAMCVTRLEIEALLSQGLPDTPMAGAYIADTSEAMAGVWLATGQSCRKLDRARIVSDSFRFVILKYLEREGEHSAGFVPDDKQRIASHAKRGSPESVS